MIVFLDLETRSQINIKECGGFVYSQHPLTELLCGAAMIVDGTKATIRAWSPHAPMASLARWHVPGPVIRDLGFDPRDVSWAKPERTSGWVPGWLHELAGAGALLVAHNGEGFDRPALEQRGLSPDARWLDTAHRARMSGLPAGLDAIGESVFGVRKDKRGRAVLERLYKPVTKGAHKGKYLPVTAGNLALITRYCVQDVIMMAAAYYDEGWDQPHVDDPVRELHVRMNRAGIPVDVDLASRLLGEAQRVKRDWLDRVALLGVDENTLRSAVAFPRLLAANGVHAPDARKETVKRILDAIEVYPLDAEKQVLVKTACEARLAMNRITEGKAKAALVRTSPDRRMREATVFWGAHTGRWAGRGMQVQNLPGAPEKLVEDHYGEDLPKVIADTGAEEEDLLAGMLRGIVTAPPEVIARGGGLAMVDYSQIEARSELWLAGDEQGLDTFRLGRDLYISTGCGIFGGDYDTIAAKGKKSTERTVGKIATLALGYQGGPNALNAFAGSFSFEDAGLDRREIVDRWRDANWRIAGKRKGIWRTPQGEVVVTRQGGLWRDIQTAAIEAVTTGRETSAARCRFELGQDKHLRIFLPSGRALVYREARYEPWESNYGETKNAITFMGVRFGKAAREATYGGRLTENITQAFARDVMAHAMLALDAAGYELLFTVHDEVILVVEDPDELSRVEAIMCELPSWAEGLPLAAVGEFGTRYKK